MTVAKYELTKKAKEYKEELEALNKNPHTTKDESEFNEYLIERAEIYGKERPVGEAVDWDNNLYEQIVNGGLRITPNGLLER
ncbi:hypothetical protein OCA10_29725 [Bacillus cereus]|nr:hypothetical protein [Bacillus cereus]